MNLLSKILLIKNRDWYKNLNIFLQKIILPLVGLTALIWFLIRVVPKPSRVTYPCVQAVAPIASSFVLYLLGLAASITAFRKVNILIKDSRYLSATLFIILSIMFGFFTANQISKESYANVQANYNFSDPLGANNPIGEAKGIFPGRVVWIYNPDATNVNCTNENIEDTYFLDKNTSQEVVDKMFSDGILSLTGKETHSEAWDAIFRYYNSNHNKSDIGYTTGEKIFIKINAVSAWSGIGTSGEMKTLGDDSDTTPQTILTMLRHLVNEAGVPEEYISVGDPIAGIWNHVYNKLNAEFPNVNYMDWDAKTLGRTKLEPSELVGITFSDKGTVMDQISEHKFFNSMMEADYLLNIPTMKGHRWGGVTLFSKNHFGSNINGTSWQLHKGLMNPDNNGELREGYKKYRVLTDLMASKNLGQKTLLFFMDGLWSTSYEHNKPQKFNSKPFNRDWSSSLIFSLDPVAIESVCLDMLQKEFKEEDLSVVPPRYTFVQWQGVDDYLHQAADSSWWPEGIKYDPDLDGSFVGNLGVHEHWNNADDMQYSRNLGTGDGIELLFNNQTTTRISLSEAVGMVGDTVKILMSAEALENIGAMNLYLKYSSENVEFIGLGNTNIPKFIFGVNDSVISMAMADLEGFSYTNGTIAELLFIIKNGSSVIEILENSIVTTVDFEYIEVEYINGLVKLNEPPVFIDTMPSDTTLAILIDETFNIVYQYEATDPEGEDVTFSLINKPDGGFITPSGLFTFSNKFEAAPIVFQYEIIVKASDGILASFDTTKILFDVIPAVDDGNQPMEFKLSQNYPNPFNPKTNISYTLNELADVNLTVFDMIGRKVTVLVDKEQSIGSYNVVFDANKLSSGTYIYKLSTGKQTAIKKMLLIK